MAKQYTPKRRIVMQVAMWVILLATIGLAAIVSSHRRNALLTKLDPPIMLDGFSIRLPRAWRTIRPGADTSSLLLSARDTQEEFRGIEISRDWVDLGDTPAQMVFRKMRRVGTEQTGETQTLAIAGSPAGYATSEDPDHVMTYLVAAIVPTSGRAITVTLHSMQNDSAAEDLMKRILDSIELKNEPSLEAAGASITLHGTAKIALPNDLAPVPGTDRNDTSREMRNLDSSKILRRVRILPTALEPGDGTNTIRTMLSMCESELSDSRITSVGKGEYRIDPNGNAADRSVRPIRAYALANPNGRAILSVFKGGEDEQWIEDSWSSIRDHTQFESDPSIASLSEQGAQAVAKLAESGLAKIAPQDGQEHWLLCTMGIRNFGWVHATLKNTGWGGNAGGGNLESRFVLDSGATLRNVVSYQSAADLKSHRGTCDSSVSMENADDQARFQVIVKGSSQLRDGKLNLSCAPGEGESSVADIKIPANYLPGGWMPQLLASLPDEKILLRTDMAWGYEYACVAAPLIVTVETDADFKPATDAEGDVAKCKVVEVLGSGEKMRWYFDKSGKLLYIEAADNCKYVRRDENEVKMSFSRAPSMRP